MTTHYRIVFNNQSYDNWTISNPSTLETVILDEKFNPNDFKLMSNDLFDYKDGIFNGIVHSPTRLSNDIPAVLILEDNKTYGRERKPTSGKTYTNRTFKLATGGRLLYKCVPDDMRLPIFLVPYEIKELGFSKVQTNKYVTIKFNHWDYEHPVGMLTNVIGDVDMLDNFYEYQLYCKSLNNSIQKFNNETNNAIKTQTKSKNINPNDDTIIDNIYKKHPEIEDRTSWKTFTIDPSTTNDYDDAFSVKYIDDNICKISIYIANVSITMDFLNLWSSFSQRISTIYLPDRKRPMLPTILSDCLCSLQSRKKRIAFVMDVMIDEFGKIISINFSNAIIRIYKNHVYDSEELLSDSNYLTLCQVVSKMSNHYKYISTIKDSHDVVTYLMILMNYNCAKKLIECKKGIFRTCTIKETTNNVLLPEEVNKFIKMWNSTTTQYVNIEDIEESELSDLTTHDFLEIDAYVHITSPIRRLVDMLNMMMLQSEMGLLVLSPGGADFYSNWVNKLDYINVTMRSIRRVQTDCALLEKCVTCPEILEKTYEGYCFDKLVRNDGLNQYLVYIPELKMASKITIRDDLENFDKRNYKLFLFNDEEHFKRKIRLQLM